MQLFQYDGLSHFLLIVVKVIRAIILREAVLLLDILTCKCVVYSLNIYTLL